MPCIDFLGFTMDSDRIHPAQDKIRVLILEKRQTVALLGTSELLSCLPLPSSATEADPLHRLLGKRATWVWGHHQAMAFQAVKDFLMSNKVLAQFDETLPVIITCNASPYRVGIVLGQQHPDGREVPITYFSQTLSSIKHNYMQTDKEGLAIVKTSGNFMITYMTGPSLSLQTMSLF